MAAKEVAVYTRTFAPWEEGADEREETGLSVTTFDCVPDEFDVSDGIRTAVDKAVKTLKGVYATDYSASDFQPLGWWSGEPYEHPLDGSLEETSAHLHGFAEDERYRVWQILTGVPVSA